MSVVFSIDAPYRGRYELHRLTYGSGGPSVAIVAGLHGNELNGIHAVNLLNKMLRVQRPKGTVHLFPLVNTFGADQATKRWPYDDQDINHAFPGDPDGSVVQRIAHALFEASDADLCIDVHSGAPHVRELPQVRAPMGGEELALARAMKLPVVWRRPGIRLEPTGLVGAWRAAGRNALHIVGGRGITLDNRHATTMANGLANLLGHLGISAHMDSPMSIIGDVTHANVETHRASCGGFFVAEVRVGDLVKPGHLLGYIQSPVGGERLDEVRALCTGVVMTVRAYPMIHAQELLVRVAGTT
ncbi:MAG: succinylglutamate desuccinylase/aspartoacylase family protein [Myxococcota bacterium]|nr:succinylglutamate desuccinylase/aspartoacylase family protein [Myxococcota bacterium]MEC9390148.1 succinylglutamate desuccinylase/aspartoacylase family protein [Myxococcota bacterium]